MTWGAKEHAGEAPLNPLRCRVCDGIVKLWDNSDCTRCEGSGIDPELKRFTTNDSKEELHQALNAAEELHQALNAAEEKTRQATKMLDNDLESFKKIKSRYQAIIDCEDCSGDGQDKKYCKRCQEQVFYMNRRAENRVYWLEDWMEVQP